MKQVETTNEYAKAVGMLYKIADEYAEKFKIGGKQKLQKIVGEELFYKKGNRWCWNNPKIVGMTTEQLKSLAKKIENASTT
jgi:hypothetical protein